MMIPPKPTTTAPAAIPPYIRRFRRLAAGASAAACSSGLSSRSSRSAMSKVRHFLVKLWLEVVEQYPCQIRFQAFCTGDVKCKTDRRQMRSEEHTSELQSRGHLVCRLLLEK